MTDNLASTFRRTMGRFTTGVAVVLASHNGRPIGLTVNSLTSVSLDPLLLLFCAQNVSQAGRAVIEQGAFSVNILTKAQEDISVHFAQKEKSWEVASCERHEDWFVIPDSNGILLCELANVYPGGDHQIIVGRVKQILAASEARPPLLYHEGQYSTMNPKGRARG
jgi:3-hydroxy-9,10-secoandrosta-1,3,5(10)-triene-9,17-dione monooxygenase reductase component